MSHFYVLVYENSKNKLEFWFRDSAVEIVDCIQDFMYPEDEYDENPITIMLRKLDSSDVNVLDDTLQLDKYLYENPPNIDEIINLAEVIDLNNKDLQIELIDGIRYCSSCDIYTQNKICICQRETRDCDD